MAQRDHTGGQCASERARLAAARGPHAARAARDDLAELALAAPDATPRERRVHRGARGMDGSRARSPRVGRGRRRGRPRRRRLGPLEPGRPRGRMGSRRRGGVARCRAVEPRARRLPCDRRLRVHGWGDLGGRAHGRGRGARGPGEALVAGSQPREPRRRLVGGSRRVARPESLGRFVDDRAPGGVAVARHRRDHRDALRVDRVDLADAAPRARRGRADPGDACAPLDARHRGGARGPPGACAHRRDGEPRARPSRHVAHGLGSSRGRRRGRSCRAPHRGACARRRRRLGARRVDGRQRVLRRRMVRHAVHWRARARDRRRPPTCSRGRCARRAAPGSTRSRGPADEAVRADPAGGDPGDAPRAAGPGGRRRALARAVDLRADARDHRRRRGLRARARSGPPRGPRCSWRPPSPRRRFAPRCSTRSRCGGPSSARSASGWPIGARCSRRWSRATARPRASSFCRRGQRDEPLTLEEVRAFKRVADRLAAACRARGTQTRMLERARLSACAPRKPTNESSKLRPRARPRTASATRSPRRGSPGRRRWASTRRPRAGARGARAAHGGGGAHRRRRAERGRPGAVPGARASGRDSRATRRSSSSTRRARASTTRTAGPTRARRRWRWPTGVCSCSSTARRSRPTSSSSSRGPAPRSARPGSAPTSARRAAARLTGVAAPDELVTRRPRSIPRWRLRLADARAAPVRAPAAARPRRGPARHPDRPPRARRPAGARSPRGHRARGLRAPRRLRVPRRGRRARRDRAAPRRAVRGRRRPRGRRRRARLVAVRPSQAAGKIRSRRDVGARARPVALGRLHAG